MLFARGLSENFGRDVDQFGLAGANHIRSAERTRWINCQAHCELPHLLFDRGIGVREGRALNLSIIAK